jgi:hypothetical protein
VAQFRQPLQIAPVLFQGLAQQTHAATFQCDHRVFESPVASQRVRRLPGQTLRFPQPGLPAQPQQLNSQQVIHGLKSMIVGCCSFSPIGSFRSPVAPTAPADDHLRRRKQDTRFTGPLVRRPSFLEILQTTGAFVSVTKDCAQVAEKIG